MRLTTFTDYSLRVLIYLAGRPGERARIAEVASAFDISEHHVVKVVQFLGREGFLRNTRGRGGGMQLAAAPSAINIGRVVRLAEGEDRLAECFDTETNACCLAGACRMAHVLDEARQAFYATLERYTLEDLRVPAPKLAAALRFQPRERLLYSGSEP